MQKTARRGPGRPPAAKSALTRGRILHAAREVFTEVGFDAATFQEIANRADLTRPAINHYYDSKHALYRQVVEQANASVIAAALEQAGKETTFTGRVRAFLEASAQARDTDRAAAEFLVASVLEAQRHPELTGEDSQSLELTRQFAKSAVRDGIANGELRADLSTRAVTEMLVAAFWGLSFYAGLVGDAKRTGMVTGEFIALLEDGGWLATA
ncbi:MAG: TetR/AcrR family transcriptional regulator [Mycobacterium sp.]